VGFVCLLQIHLFFPESGSLKTKRKDLVALKAQLQRRFGAAVSETDHHELWQRATLSAALVGPEARSVDRAASMLERYVESRFPDGVRVERALVSADEVLG
jgi:uncharacterized protein YlxP (DUF503 family)